MPPTGLCKPLERNRQFLAEDDRDHRIQELQDTLEAERHEMFKPGGIGFQHAQSDKTRPVVRKEVGDCWSMGVASDPKKASFTRRMT